MKKVLILFFLLAAVSAAAFSRVHSIRTKEGHGGGVTQSQWEALDHLRSGTGEVSAAWNQYNGTPTFLTGRLTKGGFLHSSPSAAAAALNFLEANATLFRLTSPAKELRLLKAETDEIGMTHVKFNQYYQGIMVFGAQIIVHFGADGAVTCVNGRFGPTPSVSVTPALSANAAEQIAARHFQGVAIQSSSLILYPVNERPALAYRVAAPTTIAPLQYVVVDAATGAILGEDSGIRYDGPVTGTGPSLAGTPRQINIYQGTNRFGLAGAQYWMIDATKMMYANPVDSLTGVIVTYDAQNDTNGSGYGSATMVYDPSGDTLLNDNARLPAAVDAHHFTGVVYDYYRSAFNRNSFDNAGSSLINVVHYLKNYNNAFWNGHFMSYGDGDGVRFSSLPGALDVTAHEITHGVTSSTADLVYQGESGALNESYSDVMACMLDSANWLIGEEVYTPGTAGDALRSMADPHQGGSGPGDHGWQPATMNEYLYWPHTNDWDHGGVHTNSGIPNHAAYLVGTAIGHARTAQIYYRTLTHYLTNGAEFVDARNSSLQAAADLYGSGGTEYNAVGTAFDNVGIPSNLPRSYELAYDSGSPQTFGYEPDAGWGLANMFTIPVSGKLLSLSFVYDGDFAGGNGAMTIKIFGDNAGTPGSMLASTPFTPPAVTGPSWISVTVPALDVGTAFYIGLFYDGTNEPKLALDTVANGHAWEYQAGPWVPLNSASYYPATFYIRAVVSTLTAVHELSTEAPREFGLLNSYPNPFNPATTIGYGLPKDAYVSLKVYDGAGREVSSLVTEDQHAGSYRVEWRGVDNNGSPVASGVYYARLVAGGRMMVQKLLLLR